MTISVVRTIGWLAIAHGLSHAILPLRGSFLPAVLIGDWTPVLLYIVSTVGFVAAGLGLLGLRPLHMAISPLLVLSSGLSLVAIQHVRQADLWFGGAFDAAFFFVGLWRAYAGWPVSVRRHARIWHLLGFSFGFLVLTFVAVIAVLSPLAMQRTVTIDRSPNEVWPVLLRVAEEDGWNTVHIDASRATIIADQHVFVLLPAGDSQTRFTIGAPLGNPRIREWSALVQLMAHLPDLVQERRLMLAIKTRAEQQVEKLGASR